MKLHAVTWEYAERFLGGGTRTYSSYSADLEIDDEYHPQRGRPTFTVPTFWVPDGQGSFLRNGIASELPALYRDGDRFLLPVHPGAVAFEGLYGRAELLRCAPGPPIEVVPSANARTVFVRSIGGAPVVPHFLKLHYPRRLSRFTRRLRRPIIALQLWVADELARIGAPVLPEVAGGVFGGESPDAWGYVVRESVTDPTVPLFALYGQDILSPGDPTLLEQLVDTDPERFLCERIVVPMVRLWLDVVTRTGCVPELHGQNTLVELSDRPRIRYRDCGIYVDPAVRAGLGLGDGLPPTNVISRDVLVPREQVFSLTYDSFLGHHALAYVAALGRDRFGVPPSALHSAARAAFAGASVSLPETVYYYDNTLYPDGRWQLTDTGLPPLWRSLST